MIHPACRKSGVHGWSEWYRYLARADGSKVDETPDGLISEPFVFRYRRTCDRLGCDAHEYAEDLAATGRNGVIDLGGSEVLYRRT